MVTSSELLDLIRADDRLAWVVEQLLATFAEGIAAKVADHQVGFERYANELPIKDRNRREKYETSRPFTENEKFDLILNALQQVYKTLPDIQQEAFSKLRQLGSGAQVIQFVAPDEEERLEGSYTQVIARDSNKRDLANRLDTFLNEVRR